MPHSELKLARLGNSPEIFHSLQGEGVSIGLPSIFIRASLCNLHCRWCDTDYTWNWEGTPWEHENDLLPDYQKFRKDEYITTLDVTEVVSIITSLPCHNIILTGGEPLLQDEAWCTLMQTLLEKDEQYRFEVETNGTLTPSSNFDTLINQYNVSPKLKNSGNKKSLRIQRASLQFFSKSDKSWFKFVIAAQSDLEEIETLIQKYNLPQERILLMPEGRDTQTLEKRRLWLANICREKNFRFSDRLHINLWGSKRGV